MISSSGTSSKPPSASMPFRYLIGCPLGSWIMRKAIAPSLEVAGNILTGTSTSERRRLPDQMGMGAMGDTRGRYGVPRIWSTQVNKDGPRKEELELLKLPLVRGATLGSRTLRRHHEK